MSNGPLPKKVDPRKLAERNAEISGSAKVADFTRFASFLCSDSGSIDVALAFSIDQQHLRTVTGTATGQVFMTCQRCLEPVAVDVKAEANLAVVLNEEQAKNLPGYYDPLLVEDEDVEFLSLIEDELILSLPSVPYHDDCTIQTSFGDTETIQNQQDKPNPFSVLARLKDTADKS
ncbi:YceD family protein [Nitrincola alkalilacustris]|uniref:YceD family protein n=1 Tax=Nitrincola alkalilacustris TaxID=1571224 RepID=UPI00124EE0C8|nr:YceD family protein [Nitrincola alkalilacustris]